MTVPPAIAGGRGLSAILPERGCDPAGSLSAHGTGRDVKAEVRRAIVERLCAPAGLLYVDSTARRQLL